MENASKALLLAAEVLIGVLVLTLCIYLYINFSTTSKQIQEDNARTQIDMFNAQFTSIANKENITIYDIVTLANFAKENNGINDNIIYTEKDIDYIEIDLKTTEGTTKNLETLKEEDLNKLIKDDQLKIKENTSLPTYKCTEIHTNEITLKVDKIMFEYKE